MTRLLVHVEGQTEETFVEELLRPHLLERGFSLVSAKLMGNARLRENRGGVKTWPSVRDDITRHLLTDRGCYSTSMVDYYALPQHGQPAWPGRALANTLAHQHKACTVEEATLRDLAAHLNIAIHEVRFVPYVVMHEFEALLFSECKLFATGIGRSNLSEAFQKIRDQFSSPEEINDSPQTAPSKRIEKLVPGYQKPLLGNLAALEIGLNRMRAECPQFAHWLNRLEAIGMSA
jgi:hypothetical protein